jgi:hypothetical protein
VPDRLLHLEVWIEDESGKRLEARKPQVLGLSDLPIIK